MYEKDKPALISTKRFGRMRAQMDMAAEALIRPMLILSIMLVSGCAGASTLVPEENHSAEIATATACPTGRGASEVGVASYYADSLDGNLTASGEVYDKTRLTAAHKTLTFGTTVCVTNLEDGRYVVVKVNDRGPFIPGRIIDLSRAAASEIGLIQPGIARVSVTVIRRP